MELTINVDKMITKKEIEECGWRSEGVLVDGLENDQDVLHDMGTGDVLIDGWEITINKDLWYNLYWYKSGFQISKRWYRNEVGQEWNIVFSATLHNKQDLLIQMDYLGIPVNKK